MFGISWTEFLVILLIAICVVPAKYWPDVARFFARVVKYIRNIIWKITDFSENLQHRIDLEKPIDDLLQNSVNEMFGEKTKKSKKSVVKKVRKK
ncbi:MAG: twin-arginine translocase TatA/TatE family subunit [Alphaproteobacteria bacterium]|nr:twin-arginine translocase TatA/TatE family subunit [Alphaproteobacteria bacterium]